MVDWVMIIEFATLGLLFMFIMILKKLSKHKNDKTPP
jgi:hypothetical protein